MGEKEGSGSEGLNAAQIDLLLPSSSPLQNVTVKDPTRMEDLKKLLSVLADDVAFDIVYGCTFRNIMDSEIWFMLVKFKRKG